MRVYKTGHHIADTVADAVIAGGDCGNVNVGYGILRGMDAVMKSSPCFVHLDNGYFKRGHFDGYYRVSLNGTQQTSGFKPDYGRFDSLGLDVKPWRGCDWSKPVLVVPPTDAVCGFFDVKPFLPLPEDVPCVYKYKDGKSVDFNDYNYVLTFNSSLGWQALLAGVPCVSDPTYSMVGSFMHNISLDEQGGKRLEMFACMSAMQFTLSEIRAGELWRYISGMIAEKPSVPMSVPIQSSEEPMPKLI